MSITIQMGENPKPTAVIELANKNYSAGSLSCVFNYSLAAMSGGNYWGYGVQLQYGGTSVTDNTLTIIASGTSRWDTRTGQINITKNSVFSTPQNFYFRLKSISPAQGSPGAAGTLGVDADLASKIISVENFDVEGENFLEYQSFFNAYTDLYLWAWKNETPENTGMYIGENWGGYRGDYKSGERTKFDSKQLAQIYKTAMPDVTVGTKINFRYIIKTYTGSGGTYIGEDSSVVQGTVQGNIKLRDDGTWKNCVPFVRSDNTWKPCAAMVNSFNYWKDGKI